MNARSRRAEVRNPVLALPTIRALQALDPEIRAHLCALLLDLRRNARARSEKSWKSRKAFLAAYWAVVSTYAGHVMTALRPQTQSRRKNLAMIVQQEGYRDVEAADWAEASRIYSERRDNSGLGASMFPEGTVALDGVAIGRISYNGRIWPPGPWRPDMRPIHDNRVVDDRP
jgi:hypothetical protein